MNQTDDCWLWDGPATVVILLNTFWFGSERWVDHRRQQAPQGPPQ